MHRAQEGVDRLGRLLQRDIAMAAFLVQATEARVQLFKSGERGERRGDVAEQTLCMRAQIQDIAILRHRDQQGVSGP